MLNFFAAGAVCFCISSLCLILNMASKLPGIYQQHYLTSTACISKLEPIDLMTGLPVEPPSVADALRVNCIGMRENILERPFFITNYFRKMLDVCLREGTQIPLITPYRPNLFRLKDLRSNDMHELLFKFPTVVDSFSRARIYLQRRWRPASGEMARKLQQRASMWIEEREIVKRGYDLPSRDLGMHIHSPYSCLWYHIDQTDFELKFGLVQSTNENPDAVKIIDANILQTSKKPAALSSEDRFRSGNQPAVQKRSFSWKEGIMPASAKYIYFFQIKHRHTKKDISTDHKSHISIPQMLCRHYRDAGLCQTRFMFDENTPWWAHI